MPIRNLDMDMVIYNWMRCTIINMVTLIIIVRLKDVLLVNLLLLRMLLLLLPSLLHQTESLLLLPL